MASDESLPINIMGNNILTKSEDDQQKIICVRLETLIFQIIFNILGTIIWKCMGQFGCHSLLTMIPWPHEYIFQLIKGHN